MANLLSMGSIFLISQIITMGVAIILVFFVMLSTPSKAQVSCSLLGVFTLVYLFGYLLEISSDNLQICQTAVKVEYFGEVFLIMSFTWFIAEFCHVKLSRIVYFTEGIISLSTIVAVCTIEYNQLFYRSMSMDTSGSFVHLHLEYGPVFYIFATYLAIVSISSFSLCHIKMREGTGLEKKRLMLISVSMYFPWIFFALHYAPFSHGYELSTYGTLGMIICISITVMKYGYFDSVEVATENALNYGKEGILVIDLKHKILYSNDRMREIFPDIKPGINADDIGRLHEVLTDQSQSLSINNKVYDLRIDPLLEKGYTQGFMLWAIDITEHHRKLTAARKIAYTDDLTGLLQRAYFKNCIDKYLKTTEKHLKASMLMIDMDNFKGINDKYGHDVGDKILQLLGKTLMNILPDQFLCRIGGDEFCIFLQNIDDAQKLEDISREIIYTFKHEVNKAGYQSISSLSIGIAQLNDSVLDSDNNIFEELYRRADRALYISKHNGKDTWYLYDNR